MRAHAVRDREQRQNAHRRSQRASCVIDFITSWNSHCDSPVVMATWRSRQAVVGPTPQRKMDRRMWSFADRMVKAVSDVTVGTVIVLFHVAMADRARKQPPPPPRRLPSYYDAARWPRRGRVETARPSRW